MRWSPILLLLAGSVLADPPKLVIPPEVRPAGQYVRVIPETDAVAVVYVGLSGVDAFPSEELRDSRRFVLDTRGLTTGRYRFAAVGAGKGGEQTRTDFTVVIGDAPPPEPVPPPQPDDPLTKALQAAYAADGSPDKAKHRDAMAALYKQAATTARDPAITTLGDLFAVMKKAAASLLPSAALLPVRQVVAAELVKVLGSKPDAPLDAATREAAATTFLRIGSALEGMR